MPISKIKMLKEQRAFLLSQDSINVELQESIVSPEGIHVTSCLSEAVCAVDPKLFHCPLNFGRKGVNAAVFKESYVEFSSISGDFHAECRVVSIGAPKGYIVLPQIFMFTLGARTGESIMILNAYSINST